MGGPATTNPWLIAIINMTIVFGVLGALGIVINVISMIDPTQKKTAKPETVAAPVAAPVEVEAQDDTEVIAVIAAAVAAASGSEGVPCVRIKRANAWTLNAAAEAISVRKECF